MFDLEFKIARSEKKQELYQCLHTITAFAGGFTALCFSIVASYLFTQSYTLFAERAAWMAIIAGFLTALAMLTTMVLKLQEFTQGMKLTLQYRSIKRIAVHVANTHYDEGLVE